MRFRNLAVRGSVDAGFLQSSRQREMSRPLRAAHAQCANIFASRHSPFGQVQPFRCLQAEGQSSKHLRRRNYPASTVVRPCPTPARSTAKSGVEVATSDLDGSPPITRITIPTCRVHYPGGPNKCMCRLLPCRRGLPHFGGGSASALTLSRHSQASLALRPAGSLDHPTSIWRGEG